MELKHLWLVALVCVVMAITVLSKNKGSRLCQDKTGYNCLFKSNTKEFVNVKVTFDNALPSWLEGTLVRNGAGLFEGKGRSLSHAFDGLAKLSSWTFFPNRTTVFSTQFVRSTVYKKTKSSRKIAPFLTFLPTKPRYKLFEKGVALFRGLDNMNINVFDFPGKRNNPAIAVLTDGWKVYEVSIKDLSTKKLIKPKLNGGIFRLPQIMMSSAHPVPEPGTSNRLVLSIKYKASFLGKSVMSLLRATSISARSVIAEWKSFRNFPFIHAFAVTETKAIIHAAGYFCNNKCVAWKAAVMPCMQWSGRDGSYLYIADLKTGVKKTIKMKSIFSLHHINAYDLNKNEIIMDVVTYDEPKDIFEILVLDVIRNEKKRNLAFQPPRNKRILINLKKKTAKVIALSTSKAKSDGIDMPSINERYRSMRYCFAYGITNFSDGKRFKASAILKKNMCKGGKVEGMLYTPFHYPAEPTFVANPKGETEDDGVLLVPVLRGKDAVTHLAVADAKTMKVVSKADMPTYIPISFHGRFFRNTF